MKKELDVFEVFYFQGMMNFLISERQGRGFNLAWGEAPDSEKK